MAVHHLKRHDTAPIFTSLLTDSAGDAVVITGGSVKFKLKNASDGVLKVDAAAAIVDGPTGSVSYTQSAADVDTAGRFHLEWEVTYSDGTVQTFPTIGTNVVIIHADLDPGS